MAKKSSSLKVDFSGVESSDFSMPNGPYVLAVTSVELKKSNNSGETYLAWEYKVAEGEHKGKKVWDNTSLQPQALWRLRNLLEAFGYEVNDGEVDLDLESFENELVGAEIENEKFKGKDKPRIVAFSSVNGLDKGAAAANDDDEEEEPEPEPEKTTRRKKPAAPSFAKGDSVSFQDDGQTFKGSITSIEGDVATVKVGKDEWEIDFADLTPA